MGFGGVLAQYAQENADLDRALRSLVGQVLGFVAVVAFGYWLMRRSRKNRGTRPPVSGWYADPWGAPYQRWWNGQNWTPNVREYPWPSPYGPSGVPPQEPYGGPPPGPHPGPPAGPPAEPWDGPATGPPGPTPPS